MVTTTNNESPGVTPGDFYLYTMEVITYNAGIWNLIGYYLSFRVYESIQTPNYMCEIDVLDTDGSVPALALLGGEPLILSFSAPGTPILTYVFAIDHIEITEVHGAQKAMQYIIHGIGPEALYAQANYVTKSYNQPISSIVSDIHSNYLHSSMPLSTEGTQGSQQITIPNLKPYEAIDMLRRRGTSAGNPSSAYVYFENSYGYYFVTIAQLMAGPIVKTFVHQDAVDINVYNNTWNNIISYEAPKIFDAIPRIALGGLSQQIATFDIRSRNYTSSQKTMSGSSGKTGNPGTFNNKGFTSQYGGSPGLFSMLPWNSFYPPTNIPDTTPQQMAYLSNLVQIYVNLRVNGDTTISVGNMITLDIPQPISITGQIPLDPYISGNFLVIRLCRNVGLFDEKPRYTEQIEAFSGGLPAGSDFAD